MALYDFTCRTCGHGRSVLADFETAAGLELVCTACGGTMRKAVVLAVNIGSRSGDREQQPPGATAKACGHGYACRCSVRLSRPNPFRAEIKKANAREPEF